MKKPELKKIIVRLDRDDPRHQWHDAEVETMWVEPLRSDLFRLKNIPFFACGLAYNDVVRARPVDDRLGFFDFRRVVAHSGHSTIRVLQDIDAPTAEFGKLLKGMSKLGSTYESSTEFLGLYAFDVPRHTDYQKVVELLEAAEGRGIVLYEEGKKMHR